MSTKKYKKPLYYKKSKAAEESEEYDEYYETEEFQPQRPQKHSPSRFKKSSKYNREYEQANYMDDYGGNGYFYEHESQMFQPNYDFSEYLTEESSRYGKRPGRMRDYSMDDTEYLEDSDSDCTACNSRQRRRSEYTTDYPSEYQVRRPRTSEYEQMQSDRRHYKQRNKRRRVPSEHDIDTSPYRQKTKQSFNKRRSHHRDYNDIEYSRSPYRTNNDRENPYHVDHKDVYLAHAPIGHKAFTRKHQKELEEVSLSGSETEEDEEQEEEEDRRRINRSQYQIYAANVGETQGAFQKHQNQIPRETLLSITEYDQHDAMIALKNKSADKTQGENKSIVYLPVVVMDNTIKLPDTKVIPPEILLKNLRDKADKPLEKNVNVYISDGGQGNMFEQAQRNGTQENRPQEMQVYTASDSLAKKPSLVSRIFSRSRTKESHIKPDYPVKKSYISVAPSRLKPVEGKSSKISIKSGSIKPGKSDHSMVVNKSNTFKQRKLTKKESKRKTKQTSDDNYSALITVISPDEPRTDEIRSESHKPKPLQKSASQMMKQASNDRTQTMISQHPAFDRYTPLIKQPTGTKTLTKQPTVERTCGKGTFVGSRVLEKQCSQGNASQIITIKDISGGNYEESNNVLGGSEPTMQVTQPTTNDSQPNKKKSFMSSLFQRSDSKSKVAQSEEFSPQYREDILRETPGKNDPYTFKPDEYSSPTATVTTIPSKKRKGMKKATSKQLVSKKSNVEFAPKTEEFQIFGALNFDTTIATYLYRVVQYCLGLSLHDTMMEILSNF